MDFLFQNGGQIIKNGKEEGMFFPMKKGQNENGEGQTEDGKKEQRRTANGDNGAMNDEEHMKQSTRLEDDEEGNVECDEMDPLPPPQAILGSPADAEASDDNMESGSRNMNRHYQKNGSRTEEIKGGQSSRRSSQNVVSSTDAQNGDNGDYEDADEDSAGEYEPSETTPQPGQAELLKCEYLL